MDIAIWFLILSLVFPRLTLFLAWIFGGIPAHTGVPFAVCLLGSIFFPRILIGIFIAMNYGFSSPWFIVHAFVAVLGWILTAIKST